MLINGCNWKKECPLISGYINLVEFQSLFGFVFFLLVEFTSRVCRHNAALCVYA